MRKLPQVFARNRKFGPKNSWRAMKQYKEIDDFCCKIRRGITVKIEGLPKENKQNLLKQEFSELQKYHGQ